MLHPARKSVNGELEAAACSGANSRDGLSQQALGLMIASFNLGVEVIRQQTLNRLSHHFRSAGLFPNDLLTAAT